MSDQNIPTSDDPATPFVAGHPDQVTPDPSQETATDDTATDQPVQPVPNVDQAVAADPEDLDEVAGTVVIPLYEQRLQDASARGDNADIADIMEEYTSKREDRARKIIDARKEEV